MLLFASTVGAQEAGKPSLPPPPIPEAIQTRMEKLELLTTTQAQRIAQLEKTQQAATPESPKDKKKEAQAACKRWDMKLDRLRITGTTIEALCK